MVPNLHHLRRLKFQIANPPLTKHSVIGLNEIKRLSPRLMQLSPAFPLFVSMNTAKDAWDSLESCYGSLSRSYIIKLKKRLQNVKKVFLNARISPSNQSACWPTCNLWCPGQQGWSHSSYFGGSSAHLSSFSDVYLHHITPRSCLTGGTPHSFCLWITQSSRWFYSWVLHCFYCY